MNPFNFAVNTSQVTNTEISGNPENPAVPLDPDAWEDLGWLGRMTDAGVRVNHENCIGHPPLWRAVNLIAGDVAKLPLNVYRRTDGGHERDKDHVANWLLRHKVNDYILSYVFKKTLQYHALLHGNGYAYIHREGTQPKQLVPLNPKTTEPVVIGGNLFYGVTINGQKRRLFATDVLHIKGLSDDGIEGVDVIQVMSQALALGMAAQKYGAKFFGSGAKAGGILMLPPNMKPAARKQREEEWKKEQEGLDNAFKSMLLEDGAKWIQNTITPEQGQFLETRQFEAIQVALVLGTPPHKLGDNGKVSYNSLEQENKSYLQDCLDHWLVMWEQECWDKLLTENEKRNDTHFVEFNRSALQRTDEKTEVESLERQVNCGMLLLNEARAIRNLPPVEGGDRPRMPSNIIFTDAKQIESKSAATNSRINQSIENALNDRIDRLLEVEQAVRAKSNCSIELLTQHGRKLASAVIPVLDVYAASQGQTLDFDVTTAAIVADCVSYQAAENWQTSRRNHLATFLKGLVNGSHPEETGRAAGEAEQAGETQS